MKYNSYQGFLNCKVSNTDHITKSLNITKLDILDTFPTIKVAIGYKDPITGTELESFPANLDTLEKVEVEYREFPGWNKVCSPSYSSQACTSYADNGSDHYRNQVFRRATKRGAGLCGKFLSWPKRPRGSVLSRHLSNSSNDFDLRYTQPPSRLLYLVVHRNICRRTSSVHWHGPKKRRHDHSIVVSAHFICGRHGGWDELDLHGIRDSFSSLYLFMAGNCFTLRPLKVTH